MDLIKDMLEGKEVITTGMRKEIERCWLAIEKVKRGLSLLSSAPEMQVYMEWPVYTRACRR